MPTHWSEALHLLDVFIVMLAALSGMITAFVETWPIDEIAEQQAHRTLAS
jgi:hypothetical protein